jgi:hypothetical protein
MRPSHLGLWCGRRARLLCPPPPGKTNQMINSWERGGRKGLLTLIIKSYYNFDWLNELKIYLGTEDQGDGHRGAHLSADKTQ